MNTKPRFLVIEELHMPSGLSIFEVVEDDGYFTSKGHFTDEGDAYAKCDVLEHEWRVKNDK